MTRQSPSEISTRGSLDLSECPDLSPADRRAARRLHAHLEDEIGRVDLVVTDNRRRMLTTQTREDRREIRLHHMFVGCPRDVIRAVSRLALGDESRRDLIQQYIRNHRDAIQFRPPDEELQQEGDHFDLQTILEGVLEFTVETLEPETHGTLERGDDLEDELEDISITWGRDGRGNKSIRFGSFDFDQRLIRVHPALDQSWVPRYFVEFIVYHELLHAICPPVESETEDGMRHVHTRDFVAYERAFPRYEEAMAWESEHLPRILNRD